MLNEQQKQLIIELIGANNRYHSILKSADEMRTKENEAYRELFDLEIQANALGLTDKAQELYARTKKEVRGL